MDVVTALRKRSSVRAFKPDPVDDVILREILDAAREAPSWSNTQPYMIAVASGALCHAVRADMLHAFDTRLPEGEYPLFVEYPTPLKERRQATGYGLYGVLGIAREDRDQRHAQFRKNFAFFDAPTVMFLFAHEALGVYSVLDAGIYLGALLLAATERGVGTCAQAALASFPDVVRKHFAVAPGYKLVCGVALGYAVDAAVNRYRPTRLPVDSLVVPAR